MRHEVGDDASPQAAIRHGTQSCAESNWKPELVFTREIKNRGGEKCRKSLAESGFVV